MQDEILDIFDRVTGLYQLIIDRLKERNAWAINEVQRFKVTITERDAEIKRLQTQLNDIALTEEQEQEEHVVKTDYTIDAGIGKMGICVSNLKLLDLVEELDEFVQKNGPQAAINVLSANK